MFDSLFVRILNVFLFKDLKLGFGNKLLCDIIKVIQGISWLILINYDILVNFNIEILFWNIFISILYLWLWKFISSNTLNQLIIDTYINGISILGINNEVLCIMILFVVDLILSSLTSIFIELSEEKFIVSGFTILNIFNFMIKNWVLLWSVMVFTWTLQFNTKNIDCFFKDLSNIKSWSHDQTSVSQLSNELIKLKYDTKEFLKDCPFYYVIFNFSGGFYMSIVYYFGDFNFYTIFLMGIFLILVLWMHYFIMKFDEITEDLIKISYQPNFASKYIQRHSIKKRKHDSFAGRKLKIIPIEKDTRTYIENNELKGEININKVKEIDQNSHKLYNQLLEEIGSSVDWIIFNHLLKDKWIKFDLMGLEINKGNGILMPYTFIGLVIVVGNLLIEKFDFVLYR